MQTIEDPNQQEIEPAVVSIQYNLEGQIRIRKPVEPKDTFAQMAKRGIRVTDYKETDGAERPISWEREEEEEE